VALASNEISDLIAHDSENERLLKSLQPIGDRSLFTWFSLPAFYWSDFPAKLFSVVEITSEFHLSTQLQLATFSKHPQPTSGVRLGGNKSFFLAPC